MNADLRARLERRRDALAARLDAALIEDTDANVVAALRELNEVEAALAALPAARRPPPVLPAAVALACLLFAWAAWTAPVDAIGVRTTVALSVRTSAAELRLARDARWTGALPAAGGEMRLERVTLEFTDPMRGPSRIEGVAEVLMTAGRAELRELAVEAGAILALERAADGTLELFLSGGAASGFAALQGDVAIRWPGGASDGGSAFRAEIPEWAAFEVGAAPGPPARIAFRPAERLEMTGLEVDGLKLGREDGAFAGFVSGLTGGRLVVVDTGRVHELLPGDGVVADGLRGRLVHLRALPDGDIEIELRGTADRVILLRAGRSVEATPSVLDYVYANQQFAFLFGAASFLWGMFWSARRLASGG